VAKYVDSLVNLIHRDFFNPNTLAGAVAWGLVFFAIASGIAGGIRRFTRRVESHLSDVTGLRFASAFAQVLTYVIGFIIYAHLIPDLHEIQKTLLAGVGVLSVIIGLAAQTTLGNLIAGISLVLYKPFRIGDRIQLSTPGGVKVATVTAISLGYTALREADQGDIIVPNSIMGSSVITRLNASGGP
jgi:moderate conductance mechanosensitive channel